MDSEPATLRITQRNWHGRISDYADAEDMRQDRKSDPEAAGVILDNVLGRLGLRPAIQRHAIVHLWPRIVDTAIAAHAKAERLTGSTLHISVDSSVWMNELAAIKSILLEKINSCLDPDIPPILDIRFQQRSSSGISLPRASTSEIEETDEHVVESVRGLLGPLKDEDLRQVFARVLSKDHRLKSRRSSAEQDESLNRD